MKQKKTRIIPNVNIHPVNEVTADAIVKVDILVNAVHGEILPAIKEAIKGRKTSATLFRINFTDAYLELPKSEWNKAIDATIKFYSEKEKYETCSELTALKSKIKSKKDIVHGGV